MIELHPIPHEPGPDTPRYRIGWDHTQEPILVSARSLFCAVGAIASIPQTRDNEPSLIESIVDRRSP
jgi:hypothetical protein